MPLLVEFVVVREELLRHNAEYLPVLHYDGAVVKLPADPQRTAHGNEHVKPCGVLRDILQRVQGAVKQGLLKKQILTGVAGNAQLRQNKHSHSLLVSLIYQRLYAGAVIAAVCNLDVRRSRGGLYKSVLHSSAPFVPQ